MIATGIPSPAPQKVLIIKPSALGDVVTAMPVLRGLRRTFPHAHISWLVSDACAGLIAHDSQLDEVILFARRKLAGAWRSVSAARELARLIGQLGRQKFDWVLDLQGLLRSGLFARTTRAGVRAGFSDAREGAAVFYTHRIRTATAHTVDRNLDLARQLGIDARAEDMTLELSARGRSFAETFCRTNGLQRGGFVVCAVTTTWPTKSYPARHWRNVVEELARHTSVVLTAEPAGRDFVAAVAAGFGDKIFDLSGRTTVDEMVAVIEASGGVICCDSAAKFIAPAVGVDCVTLVGPTRPEQTGPYLRGEAIVAKVPCQGCLKRRCRHITCMQTIPPAKVIAETMAMLEKR